MKNWLYVLTLLTLMTAAAIAQDQKTASKKQQNMKHWASKMVEASEAGLSNIKESFNKGGSSSEDTLLWHERLCEARLLLSKNKTEKQKIWRTYLKQLLEFRKQVALKQKAGLTSANDLATVDFKVAKVQYRIAEMGN